MVIDLEGFCQLAEARAAAWTARGAVARLERSPDDGRSKAAAWLSIEVASIGGQLCVWDSGEGELEVYPAEAADQAVPRHYEDLKDPDLPELLAAFDKLLGEA